MTTRLSELPRGAVPALATVVALLLAWRVLVVGLAAFHERNAVVAPQAVDAATGAPTAAGAETPWRQRLARNPADALALTRLALELERQGKRDDADEAMHQVLRLARGNPQVLLQAAAYFQRAGDEARAVSTLRQVADASRGDVKTNLWQVLVAAFDSGRHHALFTDIARANPPWWPHFFQAACARAANVSALGALLTTREKAALATIDERRCVIDRLQRDGQWTSAYLLWLNGLPLEQRQRVGYIFNGGFELPLTKLGFDWLAPAQDGVTVSTEPSQGIAGRRALEVAFANQRYRAPSVYQYLLLPPGRYQFDGRGRVALETGPGLRWALYCQDPRVRALRRLAYTERFHDSTDWRDFHTAFVVPGDCPAQVLRLELAAPRPDADVLGAVVAKLKGRVWFDDLRVRSEQVLD